MKNFRVNILLILLTLSFSVPGLLAQAQAQNAVPILQTGHADFGWERDELLTPDGRMLITTSESDGTIKIWERSGLLVNTIVAHKSAIQYFTISADGRLLLTASSLDGFINIWDLESGKKLRDFQFSEPGGDGLSGISFSPSAKLFATTDEIGENGTKSLIKIWNTQTGRLQSQFENDYYTEVAFSPHDDLIAVRSETSVKILNLSGSLIKSSFRINGTDFFAFSADGKKLVVHDYAENYPNKLIFYDLDSNSILSEKDGDGFLAISPNWKYTVYKNERQIVLRETETGKIENTFQMPEDTEFADLRFTGSSLVAVFKGYGNSGWKFATANTRGVGVQLSAAEIGKPVRYMTGLAISKDGKRMAWGSFGLVYLWDAENNSLVKVMEGHTAEGRSTHVNQTVFSPDGKYLVSCGIRQIKVWSSADGTFIRDIFNTSNSPGDFANSAAFSPDGKLLAVSDIIEKKVNKTDYEYESGIKIIDFNSGKLLRRMVVPSPPAENQTTGDLLINKPLNEFFMPASYTAESRGAKRGDPTSAVRFLTFSPDGKSLVSVDEHSYIRFWNPHAGGRPVKTLAKQKGVVHSVGFSPDGRKLVTGGFGDTVKIWDVKTGNVLQSLSGSNAEGASVGFSADGKYVVSGSYDKTIRIWESGSGKLVSALEDHTGRITSIAVHPAKAFFVTAATDGKINFWSLDDKKLIFSLAAFADREWVAFTPEGFYKASSKAADKYLAWRVGNKTFASNGNFQAKFSRPEIISARLKGNFSAPPTSPVSVPPPPSTTASLQPEEKSVYEKLSAMNNVALVIGNNDYEFVGDLQTAVNDAEEVAQILEQYYGYKTILKKNVDRDTFLSEIARLEDLGENTNLIIYYAGHGKKISDGTASEKAYWQPVDARAEDNLRSRWISVDEITTTLRRTPARKVLVISDSCYSGLLANVSRGVDDYSLKSPARIKVIERELMTKTRVLLSSGSNEPVKDDGGTGNHSIFASALLRGLREMDVPIFTAFELYQRYIYQQVGGNSQQLPQYSPIQNSGHYEGTFVFAKRK